MLHTSIAELREEVPVKIDANQSELSRSGVTPVVSHPEAYDDGRMPIVIGITVLVFLFGLSNRTLADLNTMQRTTGFR